jgi:hypothetical protein
MLHKTLYKIVLYLSYLLYIIALIGITTINAKYLDYLDLILKLYISIFIIVKFNPFSNTKFTSFDKEVIFSAGLFLLTTVTVSEVFKKYISDLDIGGSILDTLRIG